MTFAEHFSFDDSLQHFHNISSMLENFNVNKVRSSHDKTGKKRGKYFDRYLQK